MIQFDFATSQRIIFGAGKVSQVPEISASYGKKAFLVTDSEERSTALQEDLHKRDMPFQVWLCMKEPDLEMILSATRSYLESGSELVLGMGGGSALDTGKAIAALAANPGDPLDYLEVVGAGRPLTRPSVPYIAIPTTAGTGSEATRNAVMSIPGQRIKVSLRSLSMLPRVAVVDPLLTHSLPATITASTGLDALTQCLEPYVSNSPTPITDALCRDGILRAARSLEQACNNGQDATAREDMALTSLFGGIALANAKLGAVHGLAAPLGGMYPAPHGVVCARLLPHVVKTNIQVLEGLPTISTSLERYYEVARLLTGNPAATAMDGYEWLKEIVHRLPLPSLASFGINRDEFGVVASQAVRSSSMKGNPVILSEEQLCLILDEATY